MVDDERILSLIENADTQPTLKQLAKQLGVDNEEYAQLRARVKALVRIGLLAVGRDKTLRKPVKKTRGEVTGTFRRNARGFGFVRPAHAAGREHDIFIPAEAAGDASTGDEVCVRIDRRKAHGNKGHQGRVVRVVNRAHGQFVGTYYENFDQAYVKADGSVFRDPILVGDPGAKRARPGDKVAFDMVRYPSAGRIGEGVITEVLGVRGAPGVDTLTVLRAFNIPDTFDEAALDEARRMAEAFNEDAIGKRLDLRGVLTITIDPATARDFDDAITLSRDDAGFWNLGVHIADVGYFVPAGSELDRVARQRGTSVYLPDRVVPMLPEVISNGLASLQEGRTRWTMSALLQFDAEGRRTHMEFARSAIRVDKRFTYEEAYQLMMNPQAEDSSVGPELRQMLQQMLELSQILRRRRYERGGLELVMPEVEVDLDADGRVVGAHLASNDESHQVIEDFMLAANEAVAEHLTAQHVGFLRRAHADPDLQKLANYGEFIASLGYKLEQPQSRFELQRVLEWSNTRPERYAVHFGLLRSMKQATYTIEAEGHFALASDNYCHFTSPIRRYPDLQVHRQLAALLDHKRPQSDLDELATLAEHCTRTERRAEAAERDLNRIKLLTYLENKIGDAYHAVIIGVEDFGIFCQLVELPVEGLVHVTSLADDFYYLEAQTHTLVGRRSGNRFRLGDRLELRIARVDVDRRELDLVPAEFPFEPSRLLARRGAGRPAGRPGLGPPRPSTIPKGGSKKGKSGPKAKKRRKK